VSPRQRVTGMPPESASNANGVPDDAAAFYGRVLRILNESGIPYLVGGAFALERHTGIQRDTRDFDVFVTPEDTPRTLEEFARHGFRSQLTYPHWLGKVFLRRRYVDVIFSSGNGVARVDGQWFEHAPHAEVLGEMVRLCPVEEMVWSKSFVMERERFDGADVLHLLRAAAARLDWQRLVARFHGHERVLLAHLVLFGYVYPDQRSKIPRAVFEQLLRPLDELDTTGDAVCFGTLLSREQYQPDLAWGYRDARVSEGVMSAEQIALWDHPRPDP